MSNRFKPLQTGVIQTKAWLIIFSLQAFKPQPAIRPSGPQAGAIKTGESVDRRQFGTDRSERNMKTYQISDDRLIVVKKNSLVIKQKESDTSFEFTPSRSVPYNYVCNKIL